MKAYDFKVILEPDEINGYVVTCPSLPGCYSQGESIEDALKNIEEAILLCIEDLEAEGEVVPETDKILVNSALLSVEQFID